MAIEIEIAQANLNSNYIYITKHKEFFPGDAVGADNKKDGLGNIITLTVDGLGEKITTDIEGRQRFFRERTWVADFYRANNAKVGDIVIIEKLDDYNYRIRFHTV